MFACYPNVLVVVIVAAIVKGGCLHRALLEAKGGAAVPGLPAATPPELAAQSGPPTSGPETLLLGGARKHR